MLSLQGKYRKNETYFCNIQTDLKRGEKNEGRHTKKKVVMKNGVKTKRGIR